MSANAKFDPFDKFFWGTLAWLAGFEIGSGRPPIGALSYVIGFLLWPRLEKVKTTPWSIMIIAISGIAAIAFWGMAGDMVESLYAKTGGHRIVSPIECFIWGLGARGLRNSSARREGLLRD